MEKEIEFDANVRAGAKPDRYPIAWIPVPDDLYKRIPTHFVDGQCESVKRFHITLSGKDQGDRSQAHPTGRPDRSEEGGDMKKRLLPEAFHPGEYIREEMKERGWSFEELADKLDCNRVLLYDIIHRRQSISEEMAKALGRVFGAGAQVWLNLQATYWLTVFEMRRRHEKENRA